jgi:ABC-type Fe3+-hydroxamate transport system substrate-binding protein
MHGRRGSRIVRCGLLPSRREPVLLFRRRVLALVCVACAAIACGDRQRAIAGASPFVDDLGDTIRVGPSARRIVSLSPVTTEIIFALGAGGRLVGRTHWDLYPDSARAVADLGNGMQPNVEAILGTHPDLVVLYGSASNRAAAAQLRRAGVATIAIRGDRVSDFPRAVRWLARALGDGVPAAAVIDSVERSLRAVQARPRPAKPPTVFWHVWESPLYTIGRGSFLDELVETAGAVNVFHDLAAASPTVTMEEIVRRNPDYLLAGPVGAATIRSSAKWQAVPAVRAGRILVVDTALVGRPGIRMGEAAHHLRALIVGDTGR